LFFFLIVRLFTLRSKKGQKVELGTNQKKRTITKEERKKERKKSLTRKKKSLN
jgi:hypothetical protein